MESQTPEVCGNQPLLLPALAMPELSELVPCPSLAVCSQPLGIQPQPLLSQEGAQLLQTEGLTECATRKVRSAMIACRRLASELECMMQPSQGLNVKLAPQFSETCCAICSNVYDCVQSLPLCLPCGHTLCSSCVMAISRRGLTCPFDRTRIDTQALPVNFLLAEAALSELEAAQCPEHNAQLVVFCPTEGRALCGLCEHEEGHSHWLLDSEEGTAMTMQKLMQLGESLGAAWTLARQLTELSLAIESLLLKLTVKFNGFSLIHKASKDQRKQARRFTEMLLRMRGSLEGSQSVVERYVQTRQSVYWHASRVPRWTLLSLQRSQMPTRPKASKALEAVQRWLEHNG